ncbi:hypothetical protein AAHN97_11880 [Chitinophaga niabensis]|uniref:glycine-rich domain-containing protein n=1 Tax=Chitinophaga niabensis TaxID=536979 RepID=UPI0031BBBC56
MIDYSKDPLWQRINDFSPDDPEALIPFSGKLAREQNWSATFTQRAIHEYKRFVYLCCVSPTGASPSQIVDEVWHLHLEYTQNYWEDFCDKTLGRKLHHHPSKGGPHEKKKYAHWLKDTLKTYKQVFRKNPPDDIWKKYSAFGLPRERSVPFSSWHLVFLFFSGIVLLTGCNSGPVTITIVVLFGFFALLTISSSLAKGGKKGTDNNSCSGGGCGSGCSSGSGGCGSGCGGGCGGCGG